MVLVLLQYGNISFRAAGDGSVRDVYGPLRGP